LRLEQLEDRRLLSTSQYPEIPGMVLVDPRPDQLEGQIIYLDFDGAENLTYNGPRVIQDIHVPPFAVPSELQGREQALLAYLEQALAETFAGTGVRFTTIRPPDGEPFSTLFVGGSDEAFGELGRFLGLAETVDVGNLCRSDNAFVFSDDILDLGGPDAAGTWLPQVMSHEVAHLLGYQHSHGVRLDDDFENVAAVKRTLDSNDTVGWWAGSLYQSTTFEIEGLTNGTEVHFIVQYADSNIDPDPVTIADTVDTKTLFNDPDVDFYTNRGYGIYAASNIWAEGNLYTFVELVDDGNPPETPTSLETDKDFYDYDGSFVNVVFKWAPAKDKTLVKYTLQLSTSRSFPPDSTTSTHDNIIDTVKTLSFAGSDRWYWRVQAYDYMNHRGSWSEPESFTVRPIAPETVSASDGTVDSGIDVSWEAVSVADEYTIYRDGEFLTNTDADVRTYHDETASPGENHDYWVRARQNGIPGAWKTDTGWWVGKTPLIVKDSDEDGITVEWNAIDYADRYYVHRKDSPDGEWKKVKVIEAPTTTYTDTKAVPGKDYWYSVSVEVGSYEGGKGRFDSGWRTILPPTNVVASDTLTDRVTVSWEGALGAVEYIVRRNDGTFGSGVSFPGISGDARTYDDTTAILGKQYYYHVTSVGEDHDDGLAMSNEDGGMRVAGGLVVSPSSVTVPEGSTAQFTVKLAGQPPSSVTVSIGKQAGGDLDLTANATSLTFTPSNWNQPQPVTVSAAQDADTSNGTAKFIVSSTGLASQTVTATEADDDDDNDDQAIIVSTNSVVVPEGGAATFTVRLAAPPPANVTVTIGKETGGDPDLLAAPTSLTFTSSDWSQPKPVAVSAAQDADTANGTANFVVSSPGLTSQTVTATEADDDEDHEDQAIIVSTNSVLVPEGGAATFTVRLAAQPPANVTVTIGKTAGGDPDLLAAPTSLTFTSSDWSQPKPVTVSAAQDADAENGTATFDVSCDGAASVSVAAGEIDDDSIPIFIRRFDFGTTKSPVEQGFERVTKATRYNVAFGFGWTTKSVSHADRRTGSDLERDLNRVKSGTFVVDVPNGTYQVDLLLGDRGKYAHEEMGISLENVPVDVVSTERGQIVTRSFTLPVKDGQLQVGLQDLGGKDKYVAIVGLTIRSVAVDLTPPTATINQGATQRDPAYSDPLVFDVQFSEPVTGFTHEDVVIEGTAPGECGSRGCVWVEGVGRSYQVTVGWLTGNGSVIARVRPGAATDLSGNVSLASTSTDNTVDFVYQRRYDFGPLKSPVEADYWQVLTKYPVGTRNGWGFLVTEGWTTREVRSYDRRVGSALDRDLNRLKGGAFVLEVPNGTYHVEVRLGDLGKFARDLMGVVIENVPMEPVSTLPGQVLVKSLVVPVSDGQLRIDFQDLGGKDKYVSITGLMVTMLSPGAANALYAVAENEADPVPSKPDISRGDLTRMVDIAIEQWASKGVAVNEVQSLRMADVRAADLPGRLLGIAVPGSITIDTDAAGHGWFVDETPTDNEEFVLAPDGLWRADRDGPDCGRVDLLTAVMHELGHLLGLDDLNTEAESSDVMAGILPPGVRRLP